MFSKSRIYLTHQHKLLTTILLSLLFSSYSQAQTWELVGVTSGGISPSWGSFQNLVHDDNGNLYCSFYDGSVTKGSVMKFDGTSWTYLGGAGITPGTATYSSLTCASNNDLFYSHQLGYPASGISVQKHNGTSWITLPSAESATVNFQSITSNSSNQPIVAYSSGGSLKVKAFDGTAWNVLGTGLPAGTPFYLDAKCVNDTVYVGFVNSGMKIYKIAASASPADSWIEVGMTSFSATSSEQFRSAIAVDSNNDVFTAFTSVSGGGNKINVKKYDHLTQQWSDVGSQNFSTDRVHYVDIALDNNHVPYVAYSHFENSPNNKNYVLKFDGTNWVVIGNTAVSSNEAKWNSLIVLAGKPVLAYSDETAEATVVKEFITAPTGSLDSLVVTTTNNVPAVITSNAGTLQMQATVYELTANQSVIWSIVTGTGTAAISTTGLVTAQTNGTVWVKAVSVDDITLKDSMQITISGQIVFIIDLEVQTQNNAPAVITTNAGTLQVEAIITPSNTSNQNVTWSIVNGTGSATISTTGLVTAQSNGTVWAKAVSNENTTVKDSLLIMVSGQSSAGILSQNLKELHCYPNPVASVLNVEIPETFSGNAQVVLIDLSGKIVLTKTIDSNHAVLNLENIQTGSYILKIQTPNHNYSRNVQVH